MDPVSKRDLRKFGLTVGGAFLVLGALSWYRGHDIAPRVLWAIGALLVVPGAIAPAVLRPVQKGWMRFAEVLSRVNTRIILTVLFYAVLTPVGFILRLFRDPLNRSMKDRDGSYWVRRPAQPVDPTTYERQF